MKKSTPFLVAFVAILLIVSCSKQGDPFLISKNKIGMLTNKVPVSKLDSVFPLDSIVSPIDGDGFVKDDTEIFIYEKGGELLLTLRPTEQYDSTATIKTVIVHDARYKTATGISTDAPFSEIKDKNKISSIQNSILSAIVSVNDLALYFTIDKDKLPGEVASPSEPIEKTQIPGDTKMKNLFLGWDK